jgi:hypothetical protein
MGGLSSAPSPCWGRFSAARDKTAGCLAATGIRWNDGLSRAPIMLGPFLLTGRLARALAPIDEEAKPAAAGLTRETAAAVTVN